MIIYSSASRLVNKNKYRSRGGQKSIVRPMKVTVGSLENTDVMMQVRDIIARTHTHTPSHPHTLTGASKAPEAVLGGAVHSERNEPAGETDGGHGGVRWSDRTGTSQFGGK